MRNYNELKYILVLPQHEQFFANLLEKWVGVQGSNKHRIPTWIRIRDTGY
jgi:hypothetical protein